MKKNIALYNPYLDVMGGGEKHILSVLKVLEEENDEVSIFWDHDLTQEMKHKLNFSFKKPPHFLPNIFENRTSLFEKLKIQSQFDLFFYVTDGSYFFSSARKNIVFCMYPKKDLFDLNIFNRIKTWNYTFVSNSHFTSNALKKYGINSQVIYPYIEDQLIKLEVNTLKKENIILSVGRFFRHLHSKKQDKMIEFFRRVKKQNSYLHNFKLLLAGGLKKEDEEYFAYLKKIVGSDESIILKSNISYKELFELYKKAKIYWHFAGYGVDETSHPELVEHLGLTPLEAMAAGCITFAHRSGGPKETINDGKNGFLFSDENELNQKMENILKNDQYQNKVSQDAHEYVATHFSYEVFQKNVKQILLHN